MIMYAKYVAFIGKLLMVGIFICNGAASNLNPTGSSCVTEVPVTEDFVPVSTTRTTRFPV